MNCLLCLEPLNFALLKRLIHICLVLLYLGSALNLKASIHFCGDVLTHFGVWSDEPVECACAQFKKTDCCADLVFKLVQPDATTCSQTVGFKALKLTKECNDALVACFRFEPIHAVLVSVEPKENPPPKIGSSLAKTACLRI